MKRLLTGLLAAAALDAAACGVCIDDKIASCYDHAVITSAKAKGHAVAFFAIQGEIVVQPETRRAVLKAIEALPGALRGSGRISLENGALSFAFDPARLSVSTAGRELSRRLGPARLTVSHLRTL